MVAVANDSANCEAVPWVLPSAAGLTGLSFGEPEFATGYLRAMMVVAVIAAACIPIAAVATRTTHEGSTVSAILGARNARSR